MRFCSKYGWSYFVILPLFTLVAAIEISGCSDDDEVTAPVQGVVITEEQSGQYQLTVSFVDEEGNPIPDGPDQIDNQVLCPGIDYAQDEYGDCNMTVLSSSSFRVRCSETESSPNIDCSFSTTYDLTFVFEVTSFTGTGLFHIFSSGSECAGDIDFSGVCTITGTRIGPVPPGACGKSDGPFPMWLIPGCKGIFLGESGGFRIQRPL